MSVEMLVGDCRETLQAIPSGSLHCCVTSPPYFEQRDYGHADQIGHENTPAAFVEELASVMREVFRILRDDGTLWLNIGDSVYSGNGQPCGSDPRSPNRDWMRRKKRWLDTPGMGLPKKSLLGIPWLLAHALQRDGWTVRQEIIWARRTAFSEPSVKDRPYRQHETVFLLSKSRRYWFDRSALPEESVWHIEPERGQRGHIAPFPQELARRCILAGCPAGGTVLDPFGGSGTTGVVANANGRSAVLCELSREYAEIAGGRLANILSQPSLVFQPSPKPNDSVDAAREAAYNLAKAAGALNVATDGMEKVRQEREAVLSALQALAALQTQPALVSHETYAKPVVDHESGADVTQTQPAARDVVDWRTALKDALEAIGSNDDAWVSHVIAQGQAALSQAAGERS